MSNIQTVTHCGDCFYFKKIGVANTCGLRHKILKPDVVGCYAGSKVKNDQIEELVKEAMSHENN